MKNYSEMHAAVLGSTGSVGRQAIDALTALGVRIDLLCAGNNTDLLLEQINDVHPLAAAVPDAGNAEIIKAAVGDSCRIFGGEPYPALRGFPPLLKQRNAAPESPWRTKRQ